MHELEELNIYHSPDDRKKRIAYIPQIVADRMDVLGLAIWYMDDGNFSGHYRFYGNGRSYISCKKFRNKEIMLPFFDKLGLNVKIFPKKGFFFNSENTKKLHELIAEFIPPVMQYKLHPNFRNRFQYKIKHIDESYMYYEATESKIINIYDKPYHPADRMKYDLTIEDNSTYIVNGTIVHNSGEVRGGGGKALEFYCSQCFRTSAHAQIKNPNLGNMVTGVDVKITNKKNRFFRPYAYAEKIKLLFDRGINPLSGLLEVLIQAERISGKSGNYYVHSEYLPEGLDEYKFKSSKERGDVPRDLVLTCPKIIDAKDREQIEEYLSPYANFEKMELEGDFAEELISEISEEQ